MKHLFCIAFCIVIVLLGGAMFAYCEMNAPTIPNLSSSTYAAPLIQFKQLSVNMATTGSVLIGTPEAGKAFVPTSVTIYRASGTALVGPTCSVGSNATAYDNITSGLSNLVLNTTGSVLHTQPLTTVAISNTGIYLKTTIAATGGTFFAHVIITGYYL